jgi:hypothetical protein
LAAYFPNYWTYLRAAPGFSASLKMVAGTIAVRQHALDQIAAARSPAPTDTLPGMMDTVMTRLRPFVANN